MDINTGKYNLEHLGKINIILGKNGCGKSTILRNIDEYILGDQKIWNKVKYITPERGGVLKYESGVEHNSRSDINWTQNSRRKNNFGQFREQSIVQYRKLKDIAHENFEEAVKQQKEIPEDFDSRIDLINQLLDNIEIRRIPAKDQKSSLFSIHNKNDDSEIDPTNISSGEAELISLGIESLVFESECEKNENNILLLDEPDVHLHPDLQVRLVKFIKKLVDRSDFKIIIATHSTAIMGALQEVEDCKVGFMKAGDTKIQFKKITEPYKKILPVFGAHPLSNIFNQKPIFLVEGDDDERIWQTVLRSSNGKVAIYPCSTGSITMMNDFENDVIDLINAVYNEGKAFSLRDRDDSDGTIEDKHPIIRFKLLCRSAENLLLTDEVLENLKTNWSNIVLEIEKWLQNHSSHSHYSELKKFADDGYPRKNGHVKNIRNLIMGFAESEKPWEVAVGQTISKIKWDDKTNFNQSNSIYTFLGEKIIKTIFPKKDDS